MISWTRLASGLFIFISVQVCLMVLLYQNQIHPRNRQKPKLVDMPVNLTDIRVLVQSNTHSSMGTIRLYSALVSNTSTGSVWDTLVIQGWTTNYQDGEKLACCVRHRSGDIAKYSDVSAKPWVEYKKASIVAVQFRCYLGDSSGDLPTMVAITKHNGLCRDDLSEFVGTEYVYRPPSGKIAIFAKVLYSALDHNDLLAWFEIHKAMGVSRVLAHVTSDLNDKARRVLNYYKQQGLAELYHYSVPGNVDVMDGDTPQCWHFKGVSVFDGYERLSGYDYVVSIDPDEYVIPSGRENWIQVFNRLTTLQPDAAGFLFKTFLFIKTWGPQQDSVYSVERYLNRSGPTGDRIKHVTVPRRVKPAGMVTHNFVATEGYQGYWAGVEDIALYHYRTCRQTWVDEPENISCLGMPRFTDSKVMKQFDKVKVKVSELKQILNV